MRIQTDTCSETWLAPAKLNLFLHVVGRRSDGYHNLQTLFQLLDWGDQLKFTVNNSGHISRSCNVREISAEEDICLRAVHKLKSCCKVRKGVHIELVKRIPIGAGLGGGSSDAATVLLALNQLWSCGMSLDRLAGLGLELGSDVPVFVHGRSALAEGRGEKLQSVTLGRRYYVLVFPEFSISTADVFRHHLLKSNTPLSDLSQISLQPGRNDCEAAAMDMYPKLKSIMQDLQSWGQPHMSGTGSTIFLGFDNKNTAISAAGELKCRYNVRAVIGVDKSHELNGLTV